MLNGVSDYMCSIFVFIVDLAVCIIIFKVVNAHSQGIIIMLYFSLTTNTMIINIVNVDVECMTTIIPLEISIEIDIILCIC